MVLSLITRKKRARVDQRGAVLTGRESHKRGLVRSGTGAKAARQPTLRTESKWLGIEVLFVNVLRPTWHRYGRASGNVILCKDGAAFGNDARESAEWRSETQAFGEERVQVG